MAPASSSEKGLGKPLDPGPGNVRRWINLKVAG
jgi:hypothetical protein